MSESLGCARCGDCCERIKSSLDPAGYTAIVSTFGGLSTLRPQGPGNERLAPVAGAYMRDAVFIRRWMEPTGEVDTQVWTDAEGRERFYTRPLWRCLKFDTETRLCTAHDERPGMCRGYPWYGREPREGQINPRETRCSFWRDLPREQRPEGARPLIPIEVLR